VDVLDAALAHVLTNARGDDGLVDTTVSIRSDGNLDVVTISVSEMYPIGCHFG
jgi:hypothetical protein